MSSRKSFLIALPVIVSASLLLLIFVYLTVVTPVNAQLTFSVRLDGLKKDVDGLSSRYIVTNTETYNVTSIIHEFYTGSDERLWFFNDTIGAGASKVYSLADMSALPDDYTGYITITADGPITASLLPDVLDVVPPQGITVDGYATGVLSTSYVFTATVMPVTATVPMTYVWHADANSMITHVADLSDTVVYSWTVPGPQVITVTAANAGAVVTGTHTITILYPGRCRFHGHLYKWHSPVTHSLYQYLHRRLCYQFVGFWRWHDRDVCSSIPYIYSGRHIHCHFNRERAGRYRRGNKAELYRCTTRVQGLPALGLKELLRPGVIAYVPTQVARHRPSTRSVGEGQRWAQCALTEDGLINWHGSNHSREAWNETP